MRCVVFLALLSCVWAAEIKTIPCPDGTDCPFGKTCYQSPDGVSECHDLPEEEQQNQKLVPALRPTSVQNVTLAPSKILQLTTCFGTQCGIHCCPGVYSGTCCSNPAYCCLSGTRCCSNYYSQQPWCCLKKQRCHSTYGYCLAGAASAKVTLLYILFAFVLGVTSKYFL